jgi:hypothetical protein
MSVPEDRLVSATLGICVTTRQNTHHVVGLAQAAAKAGVSTDVFLTGDGVHLIGHRRFPELLAAARVGVCEVSYKAEGYGGEEVPGLGDKDFVTQWRNAEMVQRCDRYLVL